MSNKQLFRNLGCFLSIVVGIILSAVSLMFLGAVILAKKNLQFENPKLFFGLVLLGAVFAIGTGIALLFKKLSQNKKICLVLTILNLIANIGIAIAFFNQGLVALVMVFFASALLMILSLIAPESQTIEEVSEEVVDSKLPDDNIVDIRLSDNNQQ